MIKPSLKLADAITHISRAAGDVIMTHYSSELDITTKTDDSPVTIADQEANDLIVRELARLTPEVPIIAEESVTGDEDPRSLDEFWLVDPLDGTKEFIQRNGDFTVNIALVQYGVPVLGVVHPPVHGTVYIAYDGIAFREDRAGSRSELQTRALRRERPVVMVSRSHRSEETGVFLSRFSAVEEVPRGSSLKLCIIAEGEADLYPRFGRTMEWDIAAGHAVLRAAGGRIETLTGEPLRYGKRGLENPHFIAWGSDPTSAT